MGLHRRFRARRSVRRGVKGDGAALPFLGARVRRGRGIRDGGAVPPRRGAPVRSARRQRQRCRSHVSGRARPARRRAWDLRALRPAPRWCYLWAVPVLRNEGESVHGRVERAVEDPVRPLGGAHPRVEALPVDDRGLEGARPRGRPAPRGVGDPQGGGRVRDGRERRALRQYGPPDPGVPRAPPRRGGRQRRMRTGDGVLALRQRARTLVRARPARGHQRARRTPAARRAAGPDPGGHVRLLVDRPGEGVR